MPTRSLPPRPSLAQLKIQANELHQEHRDGRPSAAARIAAHHPRSRASRRRPSSSTTLPLADAQLVVAREYGFDSWAQLKQRVELAEPVAAFQPHPRFDEALAALDAGDLERLRSLLAADPSLVHARDQSRAALSLLHRRDTAPSRCRQSRPRQARWHAPAPAADQPGSSRGCCARGECADARTRPTLGPNGGATTMGLS